MDPKLLADVIDEYIEEHENDGGGHSKIECRAMAMEVLSYLADVLREYAKRVSDDVPS